MDNINSIEDLEIIEDSRYCNNCGAEFKDLIYDRTVANGEIYHCSICKEEHIFPEVDDFL
jgi:DNA-directed RNA polymerase subunit RPC12/RpoP